MRTKKIVYTGRRNKITRLGHTFEKGVPKDVPFDIAMRLIVHYAREHEVVWEGRLEDSLIETTPKDTDPLPAPDVAVEQDAVEEPAPPKPAPTRGRPKKPAAAQ